MTVPVTIAVDLCQSMSSLKLLRTGSALDLCSECSLNAMDGAIRQASVVRLGIRFGNDNVSLELSNATLRRSSYFCDSVAVRYCSASTFDFLLVLLRLSATVAGA